MRWFEDMSKIFIHTIKGGGGGVLILGPQHKGDHSKKKRKVILKMFHTGLSQTCRRVS